MIGEYLTAGALALSVAGAGWGGYQTIKAQSAQIKLERAENAESEARGELATCAYRLTNIQEAAASNASIPDNLTDYDVPSHWMLGEPEAKTDTASE